MGNVTTGISLLLRQGTKWPNLGLEDTRATWWTSIGLLADSTQQLNLNSSRLSLTGTKWIKWGWIPDYSNSFPYETTHKLLTWLFPIIFRNFFNIKIYNSNKKYGGFKTTNTTYSFLKKRIIFLPVAVRQQQCVVCVWVRVPTNFGIGNISINIHIHAIR